MSWYYILGIISYGIFIIQFLLSNLGIGDVDLDIDLDGEADFGVSDLLSFKGLVHFAMGFSGWLMIIDEITIVTLVTATIIGIAFIFILYFVYKLCMKFNSEPTNKVGEELIGVSVKVSIPVSDGKYIGYLPDYTEIICKTDREVNIGDTLTIKSFESGIYYTF